MRRACSALPALACLALSTGCGAKTGLEIPDAELPFDAGMDAGRDAGRDGGFDAGRCEPTPVALTRRGSQLMFVVDRSNSMDDTMEGEDRVPDDPRPSRWDVLADAFQQALVPEDPLVEIGAEFYPQYLPGGGGGAAAACTVSPGIDLRPATRNARPFLQIFTATGTSGGTPTASALLDVRAFYEANEAFVPRFVILATDGGPNCNLESTVDPDTCTCTGRPADCGVGVAPDIRLANCLDEQRAYDVVRDLYEELDVPVYVVGMDDPMRPDLADVLDEMAILGGRPRDEALGGRRFYSVRDADDLRGALDTITSSIAQCVFTLEPIPHPGAVLDVRLGGVSIPQDPGRIEGWDYTRADRGELTLFGGACERVAAGGMLADVEISCPVE